MTRAEGRRFGVTVGGAFLVIAAVLWWRGYTAAAVVAATCGGALAVAGLALPAHLGPVERAWMGLAHAISRVTTPIVMGVVYLAVLTPVGIARRAFGGNPLVHAARDGFWKPRPPAARRSTCGASSNRGSEGSESEDHCHEGHEGHEDRPAAYLGDLVCRTFQVFVCFVLFVAESRDLRAITSRRAACRRG